MPWASGSDLVCTEGKPAGMGKEDALTREILSDAEKRADRARRKAERDAAAIRRDAEREVAHARSRAVEAAREAIAHSEEIAGARIEQEMARLRLIAQEAVIDAVRDGAEAYLRELASRDEHRAVISELALDAIGKMSGHRFELVLRGTDRERWGEGVAAEVATAAGNRFRRAVQVRLAEDTIEAAGGLVVRGADGHEVADQTFETRLERLWPQIRSEIAEMLPHIAGPQGESGGE
jgi:vacuolar-type H+-ATPase subunit E/Vma4